MADTLTNRTELGRFLALSRYYAARARRERFMCGNEDMSRHWFMKASAALACLQGQIEADAVTMREVRGRFIEALIEAREVDETTERLQQDAIARGRFTI